MVIFPLIGRKFIDSLFALRIRQDMTKDVKPTIIFVLAMVQRITLEVIHSTFPVEALYVNTCFASNIYSSIYLKNARIGSLRILIKKKRRKAQSRLIFRISFTKPVLYITRVFSILLSFFDSKRSIF